MAQAASSRTGGCHCGAVRYQVQGPPKWIAHCHCASCRKTTGTAMSTYAGYDQDRFVLLKGKPKDFASSQGVSREFCPTCGTPLTYASVRWPGEIHVLVCTFDEPAALEPRAHMFVGEKVYWFHIGDNLPQFETVPSAAKPAS
jgi:hypothetical protein